ncbi:snRNP assembly protein [Grosmannia clavigera kw1407]|uniref:SnRNP assembly protein n=1 Tax=Grosmannia clavigera (strain kw1407 / UAMH 11150) TaxID=655863 RepID=F0XM45_GROCL|nr:snRNP assembly protein [Grosmannia clavigera kw1407]EFX01049.1 snRNP assembly protein [Grosmannia clavigera kw1407]
MAKRPALEALDAMEGVKLPAPKKQKSGGQREGGEAAPSAGYGDLYLDTIDRNVLDFDFEKLCSVSLSNINVYACLVCGRYYQGRGPRSHAYFHALDEDHHVFINMQTQRVYVLPEGYEVHSRSLDDIKFVADPRYTRADVAGLDGGRRQTQTQTQTQQHHVTLAGRPYAPGYVGMNNIKENDYLNVVVQALAHVPPLRNFFLLDEVAAQEARRRSSNTATTGEKRPEAAANRELVRRFGLLVRKIWNPRAFKAHVSPHELLQEVALRSSKRFTLTAQSDPADFLAWFLNHLHLGLGGSRSRPASSIVQRVFQGRVRVRSETLAAVGARAAAAAADDAMQVDDDDNNDKASSYHTSGPLPATASPSLPPPPPPSSSIPPPPGDEQERNIIPQVPLAALLAKYDGESAREQGDVRRRFRLQAPLPPYLVLHIKRFSANKFVAERNPTIVTFDPLGLDMRPFVDGEPGSADSPIPYDLVANVVHEAVRAGGDDVAVDSAEERRTWKVQLRERQAAGATPPALAAPATAAEQDKWVVVQDLFVEPVAGELLYLAESYIQIWERRRPSAPS